MKEWIEEGYPEALKVDGYDDCIVGVCHRFGQKTIIIYDTKMILRKLINNDGMTIDEALEYFEYNILGAWHGDSTPCFLEREP